MNVMDYLTISKYINECPNCGSGMLGEGYGSLKAEDSTIERTCECGFNFKYDVSDGVKPKQVKKAIDYALSEI